MLFTELFEHCGDYVDFHEAKLEYNLSDVLEHAVLVLILIVVILVPS